MKTLVSSIILCFIHLVAFSQNHHQTLRGKVFDQETLMPLIGANVTIENIDPILGISTDIDGTFIISEVPIGRRNILVSYLGYEPTVMSNVLFTTGKEIVLEIPMIESLISMEEVVVLANSEKSAPLNEMAIASARSFSVEETGRYASSLFDPARMAQNFAGVSTTGGSSDLFNEIIVRGNSPRGVLWRLEGIEIPNPNHFGGLGNSGGGISMLSSSLLASSDFYSGAFPAEFGNATSGVFDLNLRKGNNQKREYSFMLGILGTEVATEGPLGQPGNGSYLFNFRYSTLGILQKVGLNPAGDVLPEYGDLSFNIHLPNSGIGNINIFGLAGKNRAYFNAEADSTKWEFSGDNEGFNERQTVGTIGISHKVLFDNKRYLHTVFAASTDQNQNDDYYLQAEENYRSIREFENRFNNTIFRLSSTFHNKINAKNSFKIGAIASHHAFDFYARDYFNEGNEYNTFLQDSGSAQQFQSFIQWKHRLNEKWTATAGIHTNYFALTKKGSVEPRVAIKWQATEKQALSMALGIHSKPEHPVFYFVENTSVDDVRTLPNKNLDYIKSLHAVIGYDYRLRPDLRFKTEIYYQHLYDVAVDDDPKTKGSVLNTLDVWDILGDPSNVSAVGLGKNYGVDLTIEKNFTNSYYFLLSGSLFRSQFRALDGTWYSTRFDSRYQMNLLAGKEFVIGKNKNRLLAFNGKVILNGGNRTSPINLEASKVENRTVRDLDNFLGTSIGQYYRFDVGVSYKINRNKMTHAIMLDIQNVTNRLNPLENYYSRQTMQVEQDVHTGLFPVLNYRVEF
jgi:hypothetical protein